MRTRGVPKIKQGRQNANNANQGLSLRLRARQCVNHAIQGITLICKGAIECKMCRSGTYAQKKVPKTARICPLGQSNNETRTGCDECSPGYHQSNKTGAECQACSAGSFADKNGTVTCDLCRRGHYRDTPGGAVCDMCKPGTYANTTGMDHCIVCPAGYYCRHNGTVKPRECPANSMCPEGSEDHISCGLLHKSSSSSVKCSPSWALYIVVIAAIAGGVICIAGVYAVWTGSRNRRRHGARFAEDDEVGAPLVRQKTTAARGLLLAARSATQTTAMRSEKLL